MGLDTTHDAWHGPYSAFGRWRLAVCEAAGIALVDRDDGLGKMPSLWLRKLPNERYQGEWPEGEPHDPLHVLIQHSDCDGRIAHRHAGPLADRLEALSFDDEYTTAKTTQFVAGLRQADKAGEDIEFW